ALESRLEQVAERRRDCDYEAEHDRLPDRQVVLPVERDEGDEDGRTGSEQEALPGLSRRERGCELVAPDQPPGEKGADVARPDRQQHREGGELAVVGDPADQEKMRKRE